MDLFLLVFGLGVLFEGITAKHDSYFFSDKLMTWQDSSYYCRNNSARLIVINSAEKFSDVGQLIQKGPPDAWIGLRDYSRNCSNFKWINDETMKFARWNSHEPDNCGDTYCIKSNFLHKWNTWECSLLFSALCEKIIQSTIFPTATTQTHTTTSPSYQPLHPSYISTPEISVNIDGKSSVEHETMTASKYIRKTTDISSSRTTDILSSPTTDMSPTGTTHRISTRTKDRSSTRGSSLETTHQMAPTTLSPLHNRSCDTCCVKVKSNVTELSQEELLEVIEQLKAELVVSKNNTSAYRRKRISVYESRPSSVAMGTLGCVMIVLVLGWIIIPDAINLILYLTKCRSGRKGIDEVTNKI